VPSGRGHPDPAAGVSARCAPSRARTCAHRRARRPRTRAPVPSVTDLVGAADPPAVRRTPGAPPAAPPSTTGSRSTTQTQHAIDCATAPIFPPGPTGTVRFDDCGSARSEQVNAATSKSAVHLSFWKHTNGSICWTTRCLSWPLLDSASRSTPLPGSSTESCGAALSREACLLSPVCQVSSRSESFLRGASGATSSCRVRGAFF